ncbi:efflux RND transporter permease subunit [Maribacter halichondriae]|uniref:efflux RND transporter permease subunit n=1 Tax=Maribacter halichondriae TaxID=2980554 RepID=UPI00235A3C30|nr:MMPL family transporter [Maribacter sp. Hal144]
MRKILVLKKFIVPLFIILGIGSIFLLKGLKFSFDFNQFFPEGDDDLIFYQEFTEEFGTDDSFLLIAIENDETVFEADFLRRFHEFSQKADTLPYVKSAQSLTTLFYPLKTSFGYTRIPIINIEDSTKYQKKWERLQKDNFFLNSLINRKSTSLVVALETEDELDYSQSVELLTEARKSLKESNLQEHHFLGRAFFYEALVEMQIRELIVTTIASIILVFIILFLVYRRFTIVFISLSSIALALLLFLGLLSLLGRELNALAAFYPVLMLIVGASDVVHIMDSFLGKIRLGDTKKTAIIAILKEVGLTTLLTSATTAVGFASLMTSRLRSITDFGINSAIGVLVAYFTVIFFTTTLLLLTKKEKLVPKGNPTPKWPLFLARINTFTKRNPKSILISSLAFTLLCFWGISKIHTDFKFNENLPEGGQIAKDFHFFQTNFTGFRPLEVAVSTTDGHKVSDFKRVKEINLIENKLKSFEAIGNVQSLTLFYKGLHRANHLNRQEYFVLPKDEKTFEKYKKEIKKLSRKQYAKFVNGDENKARIATRVLDVGTDNLKNIYDEINTFITAKTDTSAIKFRLTGKGLLLDKNSVYIRDSLLAGLFIGLLLVSILMALLFKNFKLLLISLIPNLLPLLFAGALLGFLDIPLEASITVVFAIVFGIAVDDTIHFLGKLKICTARGLGTEEALEQTFKETGRALIITTMVLFFGFMVLLFSIYRPSVIIGLLISATLLTALALDLLLLPVLIRKILKDSGDINAKG